MGCALASSSRPATKTFPSLFLRRLLSPLPLPTTQQDHGVDKLFWLEPGALSQAQKNIVYICRPEIGLMNIIAGVSVNALGTRNAPLPLSPSSAKDAPPLERLRLQYTLGSVPLPTFPSL